VARHADDLDDREQVLLRALRTEIGRLDDDTRSALSRALDDDRLKLSGGWGDRYDGEGCVLSIAAWNMGLASGEALMHRSVAAVRVPALFDELWALLLTRLGDVEESRDAARRLVADALAAADHRPRVAVSG
jgi:hypothetical protein